MKSPYKIFLILAFLFISNDFITAFEAYASDKISTNEGQEEANSNSIQLSYLSSENTPMKATILIPFQGSNQAKEDIVFSIVNQNKMFIIHKQDVAFANKINEISVKHQRYLVVNTHINPSITEYILFDLLDNRKIGNFVTLGKSLVISPNGQIAYVASVPHWARKVSQQYELRFEGQHTFSMKIGTGEPVLGPIFSDNYSKIFVATSYNNYRQNLINVDLKSRSSNKKPFAFSIDDMENISIEGKYIKISNNLETRSILLK
jgi:hypothetical protein